jgi:NRPS condensation-like uncharacterized protein
MEADERDVHHIIKDFIRPFDLKQVPLLRSLLIKIGENKHILVSDMHHIISDATSHNRIMEDFTNLYAGLELEPLRLHYRDFSEWQHRMAGSDKIKKQEAYWREVLNDIPTLHLPTDYLRPPVQSFEGDVLYFTIDKEIRENLRKIERDSGTTLFMILLAAYNILLMKYSGQEV